MVRQSVEKGSSEVIKFVISRCDLNLLTDRNTYTSGALLFVLICRRNSRAHSTRVRPDRLYLRRYIRRARRIDYRPADHPYALARLRIALRVTYPTD